MTIQVLFFAALADALNVREQSLTLAPGSRVADAWAALISQHPTLAGPRGQGVAWAVNLDYANPEQLLSDGDELALIPPVSGG